LTLRVGRSLTDRYCLYSADHAGNTFRGEIDHPPWLLQNAEATIHVNTLGDAFGIEMRQQPATLHFVKSLNVKAWMLHNIS